MCWQSVAAAGPSLHARMQNSPCATKFWVQQTRVSQGKRGAYMQQKEAGRRVRSPKSVY